ncbi:MAG: branched-chain amino acid ABC transporter permease [candidate division Zixibacteria bacterium]|nr:branched-chain amino acid ABC transporter permease [candidate division Zixibacteria bacterium]
MLLSRTVVGWVGAYYEQILIFIGINITLAVSLNLVLGFAGQFSIGHAGFMALGGYSSAALSYFVLNPALMSLPLDGMLHAVLENVALAIVLFAGGIAAAIAGLLVGIPTLRLRGDYLAIATLGMGEIIRVVILNTNFVGGARGFTDIPRWTGFTWVYLIAGACVLVVRNLIASTSGRALTALREDEDAAAAMGINTTRHKVMAFVLGAFFAGMAGGLLAHYMQYLHTNSFTFLRSIEIVVFVVLGGGGSITGSIIAAAVLTVLPEALRVAQSWRMVSYSLLLVIMMLTRPQGLMGGREFHWSWILPRRKQA